MVAAATIPAADTAAADRGQHNGSGGAGDAVLTATLVNRRQAMLVPYRRSAVTISGRLTQRDGTPIAGARLDVGSQTVVPGLPGPDGGQAITDDDGRWSVTTARGPSREVTVAWRAFDRDRSYAETTRLSLLVRAGASLAVRPRRVGNGGLVTLSGRLLGMPYPDGGVLVTLQGRPRHGGHWRTFAVTRSKADGRFRSRYRFTRVAGGVRMFLFRARVNRQDGYPYEAGIAGRGRRHYGARPRGWSRALALQGFEARLARSPPRPRRPRAARDGSSRSRPGRRRGSGRWRSASRFSAITVVSPPTGSVAVATIVSEPASTRLRGGGENLARGRRVEPVEAVDEHDGVAAAGGHAARLLDHALDRLGLAVGRGAERSRGGGRRPAVLPVGDLLGAHAGEHEADLGPPSPSPAWAASAAAIRRSACVLPARAGPVMATREPLPNGVSHSIACTVGSSPPSARRSAGKRAGHVLVAGARGDLVGRACR